MTQIINRFWPTTLNTFNLTEYTKTCSEYTKTCSMAALSTGIIFSRFILNNGKKTIQAIVGLSFFTGVVAWSNTFTAKEQIITYLACTILGICIDGIYRFAIGRKSMEQRILELGFTKTAYGNIDNGNFFQGLLQGLELKNGIFYYQENDHYFGSFIALKWNGSLYVASELNNNNARIRTLLKQLGMIPTQDVARIFNGRRMVINSDLATPQLLGKYTPMELYKFSVINNHVIIDKNDIDDEMEGEPRYSLVPSKNNKRSCIIYKTSKTDGMYYNVKNTDLHRFKRELRQRLKQNNISMIP